jgi:hypothetical protein
VGKRDTRNEIKEEGKSIDEYTGEQITDKYRYIAGWTDEWGHEVKQESLSVDGRKVDMRTVTICETPEAFYNGTKYALSTRCFP